MPATQDGTASFFHDYSADFSFPVKKGFLAWQRRLRYRSRCDLYMYDERGVEAL